MYYEKKSTPRVIWKQQAGDVTISAIEQGYRFGKCGLRLTRRRNGKILRNYASYIPISKVEELLDRLDGSVEPKSALLTLRDEISAQTCKQAGFAKKGADLCKTFSVTADDGEKALLQSTVQWGDEKVRTINAEISLSDLYDMMAAMESSYRAYQLCKTASNTGRRAARSKERGLDICAA